MYEWQQRPGEPDGWFEKFSMYFLPQRGRRVLLEAENRYRADRGKPEREGTSGAWSRACKEYEWRERAQAFWDAHAEEQLDEVLDVFSAVEAARTRLTEVMDAAIDVLHAITTDPNASASARVAAANSILDRVGLVRASVEEPEHIPQESAWDLSNLTSEQLRTFIELAHLAGATEHAQAA